MKYSEIRAALQALGKEIGHYHQMSEGEKAPAKLRGHISDGFCSGASVDWLRTVMNGGNAASGPDILSAGLSFVGQRKTARNDFYDRFNENLRQAKADSLKDVNQRIRALNQRAPEVLDIKVKQLAEEKIRMRLPAISQTEMDRIVDEVQAGVERRTASLTAEHEQKFASINVDAKYRAFWLEFGRTMDTKLAQKFGEHRYSNLTIVRASADRQYGPPNGIKELIVKVVTDPAFGTRTGVLLGISPGSGDVAGHTIAIYHLNTGDYYMFDPNFGTYKYDRYALLKAFIWLFLKGYPNMEDGTSDNKDYEMAGKVRGEYLIYGRRQ